MDTFSKNEKKLVISALIIVVIGLIGIITIEINYLNYR